MEQQLKQYIESTILNHTQTVGVEDELLISGLLDSMSVMRVVSFIQSEFNISVPPEDITIEHFSSIETLSQYLQSRDSG